MILDAKRLANRLKEKEQLADSLSNETERVNYQLDSMRQFQDDINALNILARERSNADMIHTIHQENPQIREIQQENRQLKASIEEHQRAIELIMTKYRQHTQRQIEETKLDFDKLVKANEMNDVSVLWAELGLDVLNSLIEFVSEQILMEFCIRLILKLLYNEFMNFLELFRFQKWKLLKLVPKFIFFLVLFWL